MSASSKLSVALQFSNSIGGRQLSYSPGAIVFYCGLADLHEIFLTYKEGTADPRLKRINEGLILGGHSRRRKYAIAYGDMTQMDLKRGSDLIFIDSGLVAEPFELILQLQEDLGICEGNHRLEIASFGLCEGFVDGAFDYKRPMPSSKQSTEGEEEEKDWLLEVAQSGAKKIARRLSPFVPKYQGLGVDHMIITHLHRGRVGYPTGCLAKRLHEQVDFGSLI